MDELIIDDIYLDTKAARRIRRKERKNKTGSREEASLDIKLKDIQPMTTNQKKMFEANSKGFDMFLHGTAGTGKTFLSFYLGLKDIEQRKFDKMLIIRSLVPSREIGFLPGNAKDKARIYEAPYYGICSELYGRGDAYETLKRKSQVEFISTSYVRGTTITNSVIIIDEAQNMTDMELHSVLTRTGENCKIYICGDILQNDLLSKHREKSGLVNFSKIAKKMKNFRAIEFNTDDIVRSEFVKTYIIARQALAESGEIDF